MLKTTKLHHLIVPAAIIASAATAYLYAQDRSPVQRALDEIKEQMAELDRSNGKIPTAAGRFAPLYDSKKDRVLLIDTAFGRVYQLEEAGFGGASWKDLSVTTFNLPK